MHHPASTPHPSSALPPRRPLLPRGLGIVVTFASLLALLILTVSLIRGYYDGRQQQAMHTRQQIAIQLQQAEDLQAEGNLEAALQAYQFVLGADRNNQTAQKGIEKLMALASAPAA